MSKRRKNRLKRKQKEERLRKKVARLSWTEQISLLVRNDYRKSCGLDDYLKQGHFVDIALSLIVATYAKGFINYPKGDFELAQEYGTAKLLLSTPDGRYLYCSNQDMISYYDLSNKSKLQKWKATPHRITCLACNNDSNGYLAVGSVDYTIRVYNSRHNHQLVHTLSNGYTPVRSIIFDESGKHIYSGSDDGWIRVLSLQQGYCIREISAHKDSIPSLIRYQDQIITGSLDQSFRVTRDFSNEGLKCVRIINEDIPALIKRISFNYDRSLLCCVSNQQIVIYTWPEMKVAQMFVNQTYMREEFALFHPFYPSVVVITYRKSDSVYQTLVKMMDLKTGRILAKFRAGDSEIPDMCFTPNANRLIACNALSVQVWDTSHI